MEKKKPRIIQYNEHAKWWINGKDPITFAVQDKKSDWWLVHHDPSKTHNNKDSGLFSNREKKKASQDKPTPWGLIALSAMLGVSLGLNLVFLLLIV